MLQRPERPTGPIHVRSSPNQPRPPSSPLPPKTKKRSWLLTFLSSKWFMKSIGHEGLNNLLAAYEDKTAKAVTTFAYSAGPGHEPLLFQGVTEGKIVPARGPTHFGWDPIFEYEGRT